MPMGRRQLLFLLIGILIGLLLFVVANLWQSVVQQHWKRKMGGGFLAAAGNATSPHDLMILLADREAEIQRLDAVLKKSMEDQRTLKAELSRAKRAAAAASASSARNEGGLPPAADPSTKSTGFGGQTNHATNLVNKQGAGHDGTGLPRLAEPFFCTPNVSDVDDWLQRRKTYHWHGNGGDTHGFFDEKAGLLNERWWCDKLARNVDPWVPAQKYTVDDVVVGLFSGDNLFYSRASAMRDTWLAWLPHWYVFASSDDRRIPITGLKEKYGVRPETVTFADVQLTQLYGLKEMYLRNPTQKWFYIAGCDTYLAMDYMLKLLDEFDWQEDLWLAPSRYTEAVPDKFDTTAYPDWKKLGASKSNKFVWTSGATSWWLSNSVARAFAENVDSFALLGDDDGIRRDCNCPDKYTGLLLSMLGFDLTPVPGWHEVMNAYAPDGKVARPDLPSEYVLYHYMGPYVTVLADQRLAHEKLDRIQNADRVDWLLAYFRQFIDMHYRIVRKKMVEIRYLAEQVPHFPWRPYDIPDLTFR